MSLNSARSAGFDDVEVLSRNDYFARSPNAETRKVASSFAARAMLLRARKAYASSL